MACMENKCSRYTCDFYQFSNESLKTCPRCGDRVWNLFDEAFDHESPSGDDYDDVLDAEDD